MARKNILNRAVEGQEDAAKPAADNLVKVKAVAWLGENGVTYRPGDEFQTTADRAASLVAGKNVEVLS